MSKILFSGSLGDRPFGRKTVRLEELLNWCKRRQIELPPTLPPLTDYTAVQLEALLTAMHHGTTQSYDPDGVISSQRTSASAGGLWPLHVRMLIRSINAAALALPPEHLSDEYRRLIESDGDVHAGTACFVLANFRVKTWRASLDSALKAGEFATFDYATGLPDADPFDALKADRGLWKADASEHSEQAVAQAEEAVRWKAGHFFVAEAVRMLATQQGWDKDTELRFVRKALEDAEWRGGQRPELTVREMATWLPINKGDRPHQGHCVSPEDLNAWLDTIKAGYRWTVPDGGETGEAVVKTPEPALQRTAQESHASSDGLTTAVVNTLGGDLISTVIQKLARSPELLEDTAAAMAELESLARLPEKDRPKPLSGVNSGGVQWQNGGVVEVLTRKALGDRLRRIRKARAKARGGA